MLMSSLSKVCEHFQEQGDWRWDWNMCMYSWDEIFHGLVKEGFLETLGAY